MKAKIILFAVVLCLFGCNSKQGKTQEDVEELMCCCPQATIYLQPYGNYTKEEAMKLVPVLQEHFGYWIEGHWTFKVLEPKSLPKEGFVAEKNKYKAISFLRDESKDIEKYDVIIGLTHNDICADLHNQKDYGIIGLSYLGKRMSIVSDKRVRNKKQFWKPVLHEFIHAFFSKRHCEKGDPTCFMVDYKGKGNIARQNKLCEYCSRL